MSRSKELLTVTVGERRWLWNEAVFLEGVMPIGRKGGGTKDESDLIRKIKLACLELKGIPLEKQHVVLQHFNENDSDPMVAEDRRHELVPPNGVWVTVWIQWLPEVEKRERLRARTGKIEGPQSDRHFMITCSVNVKYDASLLKSRWGTATREPPNDDDRSAWKAIAPK
mmetsp:Transcript_1186/g.2548  ORF Transcript_1186/g.2548 Transcript_1186/m.2548 type:complete len:169 (+) Transcript_1186:79-585(+)|eukprot:CAMPEP_0172602208 /NCGR_PEP_ID=MMETSP1068-20121228/22401_1 /TAXON_ID=35684 /ORGANISM="Pseudopedinella elastica, Strain CCMP716" /LENGTH=168 /DNA_ID=CAMNT_0013403495 /DNA_START=76 /DNA_END=582 /DNA_ORIENTATION=+